MPPPQVPQIRERPAPRIPPAFLEVLAARPLLGIDVGAARGVPDHWRSFLPHMRIDAFEPNRTECVRLAATSHRNIRWHPTALAGAAGRRDLHILATSTGSSFFPPDPEFVERFGVPEYHAVREVTSLECTTLAAHLDIEGSGGPDLIKLDTQGSELEILQGMRREQLDTVLLVEVETEIHPAYTGQPVFADVHAFMEGSGFSLLDFRVQRAHLTAGIEPRHYLRRHLSTAVGTRTLTAQVHALDAVYIRPMREVIETADLDGLARFATLLQIYRYYDGIFWLLDQPEIARVLDHRTRGAVIRTYQRAAPKPSLWQRTGALPHAARRARRGVSYILENALGTDGFDPPRTAWSHTYWPDA